MCAKDKMEDKFKLTAPFGLSGDQPQAVEKLVRGFLEKDGTHQTLLGVTGSGKTFTMANVIARLNRPTLVLAHNKTLAAQLYSEFKEFFPENSVNYFVSYYDYYQPEAYIPASDVYIEKDASVNERIEKLRLMTTKALLERRDVVVVASVSCIYGLGKRKNYEDAIFRFACGERWERRDFMMKLLANYYERNDMTLVPGTFRSRGETMEIFPSYSDTALRIYFFDDEIERIDEIDPVSGNSVMRKEKAGIFPSKHYITSPDAIKNAAGAIEKEMEECCARFTSEGKYLEEERLRMRTKYDLEMLLEVGYCSGIENYSRYLDGREAGDPPGTLLDFFPKDALFFIDESHMTLPQVRGMYNGDRARKEILVAHGFRLPSCLDNRPLKWDEFEPVLKNALFISATPGDYEFEHSDHVVEQLIRPTGIPDPEVEVHKATGQVGRSARRDTSDNRPRRARARLDLDEAIRRGPRGVHGRPRHKGALHPLGARHLRARGAAARPSPRRLRCARRRQPSARGHRPAGGLARRDTRRGPRGLPARAPLADTDDRPRRAQQRGQGHTLRRRDNGQHGARDEGDETPPRGADSLQRGTSYRAEDDYKIRQESSA